MKPQKIEKKAKKKIGIALLLALIIALITFYFTKEITYTLLAGIAVTVLLIIYLFMKEKLKESDRIQKMEEVFPDFIELVSSNLRAGMTIDKAILFSSRREFYPLDQEIVALGKEIITGKEITRSLSSLAERIKSEKITKTINIIITGIKAGGNVAVLLEETAKNMRERQFVEKKAASNVLMYVIFIAFAVGVGAPALFALSTVLVSVLSKILSSLPAVDTTAQFAFTLTKVNISVNFVTAISLLSLSFSTLLASMLMGLVQKGEEKAGLKYAPPMLLCALIIYFIIRLSLAGYFSQLIG